MGLQMIVLRTRRYAGRFGGLSPAMSLVLVNTLIAGLGFQISALYMNFYLQDLGFDASFVGLFNAIPGLVTLLLGFPAGIIVDRIGPLRAMLIGASAEVLFLAGLGLVSDPLLVLTFAALQGAAAPLAWASIGAFMMSNSRPEQHNMVFSVQSALGNFTGFVGNLIGGYVPLVLALMLGVTSDSLPAIRGTIWVAVVIGAVAVIPLLLIRGARRAEAATPVPEGESKGGLLFRNPRLVLKLILPGSLTGLGAGLNIPFLNIFIKGRFGLSFEELGLVFAFTSIGTVVALMLQPILAERIGRVRSTVLVQVLSLPFLLVMGFVPFFPLVVLALVVRGALMNMANPIFFVFAMGKIPADERGRFSSANEMLWSLGWALGSIFSGWWRGLVGFEAGFNTTFALMAVFYLSSFMLLWYWFGREEAAERRAAAVELQAAS